MKPSALRILLLLLFFGGAPLPATTFEIDLSFLTAEDFKSGLRIAAQELAKQGLKSIWQINKFKGDVVGRAVGRKQGNSVSKQSSRIAYSARASFTYKWPDGKIPYVLSNSYSSRERALIARAMQAFHEKTCVQFVPRTTQSDYVKIGKFDGCFSDVGRTGGAQLLSLDDGCFVYRIVLHELMHTVGFWHEHERPDRDNYVNIEWRNILPGAQSQFTKTDPSESNTFGEPYDYRSLMHYEATSFSRNGRPTMIAKQPGMTEVMGKSSDFSASDLRRLNRLYPCAKNPTPEIRPPPPPPLPMEGNDYDNADQRPLPRPRPAPRPPGTRVNLNFKLPFIGRVSLHI